MSRARRASAAASRFDPSFGSAGQAARAIREGVISSRELTEHLYRRIHKYNPAMNAFVTLSEEQAIHRARQADEALAGGSLWGPLHGLPLSIKDAYSTAGIRTTAGAKKLEHYVPAQDAVAVARLRNAGAVLLGKTNLPEFSDNHQSYSAVAGTTNNPWDPERTPGGSSGGAAAALAAGFAFLELGSDVGGSIRNPCHFCGIYGHKPTLNLVPMEGHIPPLPGEVAWLRDLSVSGPMARSAGDLKMELEIIAGPAPAEASAYQWRLPAPRRSRWKDYRIGYVMDDPFCPVTPEVAPVLSAAVEAIGKQGADLVEGWPEGANPETTFADYFFLLLAPYGQILREPELEWLRAHADHPEMPYVKSRLAAFTASHREWMARDIARLKARAVWQRYFRTHDAFLLPVNFAPAFPHDHRPRWDERRISTSSGDRSYYDLMRWIAFATFTGCPATVAPVGRTNSGLPVGIQIMGALHEDATPIDLAARLADLVGGFQPPPNCLG